MQVSILSKLDLIIIYVNCLVTTLAAWKVLVAETGGSVAPEVLLAFVNEHFEQPGCELEDYLPVDFNTEQTFDQITDPYYRSFAKELHLKWPTLCRRITDKVQSNPENYSLIALPHPFVVPGGRFRLDLYKFNFWGLTIICLQRALLLGFVLDNQGSSIFQNV